MSAGKPTDHSRPKKPPGAISRFALRAQTDSRLVALAREGHDSAFEEIVRRYRTPLVRFASTIVPADTAEDAVQDGLIRAHKAMLADDNEIALRAWLYTIVRNGAVSERRKIRPTEELDETINGVPQPPDIFERRERVRGVVAKLKELPEGQREAIVRTELGGESAERIADTLGTSPAGVGQLVFRARAALRSGAAVFLPMPVMRTLLELGSAQTGATVVKVGAAVVVAAVAVGPGRTPVTDLEQPSAIEAGSGNGGGKAHAADGTTGDEQSSETGESTRAPLSEGAEEKSGDASDTRTASNGGDAAESSNRSAGTATVKLTSSPPDDGGGGGSQGDDGHGGSAPPPPDDDDGEHGSGGAPPPPPPPDGQGSSGGDSWDGDGGGGDHGDHDGYGYTGSDGSGYDGDAGGDGYGGGGGDHGGHH